MKTIKVITFTNTKNYGAMLQAYALQKFLMSEKNRVIIINYKDQSITNNSINTSKMNKIKFKIKNLLNEILYGRIEQKRTKSIEDFKNNYMSLSTDIYYSIKDFELDSNQPDVYITGSDQVWNYKITNGLSDVYTLNFKTIAKKISYAASIGVDKIPDSLKQTYKNKIEKLDYISVRENESVQILKELITKKIKEVVDPTLLLTKKNWDNLISKKNKVSNLKQDYIFVYMLDPNDEFIKMVNYISEKTGLGIIHCGKRNRYKKTIKSFYEAGPIEFIQLIKGAELVLTTSFHGTVFSLIYEKTFFVMPHKTTGSRVKNLLKKLDLEDRIINNYNEFKEKELDSKINYKTARKKIEDMRNESIKWLNKALEDI